MSGTELLLSDFLDFRTNSSNFPSIIVIFRTLICLAFKGELKQLLSLPFRDSFTYLLYFSKW